MQLTPEQKFDLIKIVKYKLQKNDFGKQRAYDLISQIRNNKLTKLPLSFAEERYFAIFRIADEWECLKECKKEWQINNQK